MEKNLLSKYIYIELEEEREKTINQCFSDSNWNTALYLNMSL